MILFLVLLAAFSGCVQPESGPQVKESVASEEWRPDGAVGAGEYSKNMLLVRPQSYGHTGGNLEISWRNDAEFIFMALNGTTRGWLSVGFEPSEWMKDADVIVGKVDEGKVVVLDEYSTGNYGPHKNDTEQEGTYDILQFGGKESGNYTVIEFKRKMNTGDKLDSAFLAGQSVSLIWGMAVSDSLKEKHNVAHGEGIMVLEGVTPKAVSSTAALSASEQEGIGFIREEEKATRDLYLALYNGTASAIFRDTAQSEQNHMDAVEVLIDKYGLIDPVREKGVFANQTLQAIYDRLLAQGRRSEDDALRAGATFEEISILDLEKQIAITDKEDILTVYQSLLAGSEKHLRSYVNALRVRGIRYAPQYLSPEDFDRIVRAE